MDGNANKEQGGEITQKLKDYFEKRDDVVMAFLFGSRAGGSTRAVSDWDIAVYFAPEKEYIEWEEHEREYQQENLVWSDCIDILKTDNVDLLVLNRAPASIAASAIQGTPLVIKNYSLWLKFMLIITREAEDYREFVNEYYTIGQRSASISPQDEENLKKTLSFFEEQTALYGYFANLSEKEYASDIHKRNDVERWIENIINAGIDMSKIILASGKKTIPNTYKDVMKHAAWTLKLEEDFAQKFEQWVKLRNVLAHEYLDIKWKRISGFIQNSENYFQGLNRAVQRYLEENKN